MKVTGRIAQGRLVALSAAVALALAFGPALAATINVPGDFSTVQAALNSADPGDTVVVAKSCGAVGVGFCGESGVYHETLVLEDKDRITLPRVEPAPLLSPCCRPQFPSCQVRAAGQILRG